MWRETTYIFRYHNKTRQMKIHKRSFFFSCALLLLLTASAQTAQLLTGEIIGTKESVDYSTGAISTTVNTISNVFDDNYDTYFASYERSGTWVGLDLGSPHVIKQIGYSPRITQPSRVQLAVIEGANRPDFSDAVPIYIIPGAAEERRMTLADISCSKGFRYVRYISPSNVRCNLAELQFTGYPGVGDQSGLYQPTNLPVIVVHTENSQDIVEKDLYLKGTIKVISEEGRHFFSDTLRIRGRGNASWNFPKKPYKIKFFEKTHLLGLPANAKEWTLINNYGDKTLIRNLIAFDISRRLDMVYTPAGMAVDVILNGEYKGTYQLCDQVEVRKNRVDITEMETTDITLPNLSGGYFIEIDAYAYSEESWFTSVEGMPVTIKSPDKDEITSEQRNYIVSYFNRMEQAVHGDFYNDDATYRKYLDTRSFFKNFIIGEFCGNTDTYWSTYMYKERNSDLFITGPIWDYDLAFENDNRTYPIISLTDFIFRTKGSAANGMVPFVNNIIASDRSEKEIADIWVSARESESITPAAMNRLVDSLATLVSLSQELNFKRWPILNTPVHQNPVARGSFRAEVDAVKKYLVDRIAWMDKKLVRDEPEPPVIIPTQGTIVVNELMLTVKDYDDAIHLYLYDLSGRTITSRKMQPEESYTIRLIPGIYIVRLQQISSNKNETHKVLVY